MMLRNVFRFVLPFGLIGLLAGCSSTPQRSATPGSAAGLRGSVHGGQQPIVNAVIQLYTVGITGDGSAATPKLTATVKTGADGGFSLTGLYSCTGTTEMFITATGGNPSPGVTNNNITLMTALGSCGDPVTNAGLFIQINEVTTVAAVAALAPYMSSMTSIGSGSGDAAGLATAFTLAAAYANFETGISPGNGAPAGTVVPSDVINTLANIVSACVNSGGGVAGDPTVCGQIFTLTKPGGGTAPTDTVGALLNLMVNPTLNTSGLFTLTLPVAPFQPALTVVPADFHVALVPLGGSAGLTITPGVDVLPSQPVGFGEGTTFITVQNLGTSPVTFEGLSLVGPNAADFTAGPLDCNPPVGRASAGTVLPPGADCVIQVYAVPSAVGLRTAAYVLSTDAPVSPQVIPLSIVGLGPTVPRVTLSPASKWTVDGTTQDLTLTNASSVPLTIAGMEVSSPHFFVTGSNCGRTLLAMSVCTVSVTSDGHFYQGYRFPTYYTEYTGTVLIHDNAVGGPTTTALDSVNTQQVAATAGDTIFGLTFPNTPLTSSNSAIFYINQLQYVELDPPANPQPYPVLRVTGANSGDFGVVRASYGVCDTRTSDCDYNATFTPQAAGNRSAKILLDSGPFYIPLSGAAYDASPFVLTLEPASIVTTFGNTNTATGITGLTVLNVTGATQNLSFAVSGTNASEFTVDGSACGSLAVRASCGATIHFTSLVEGTRTAIVTVTDTISSASKTIAVTANSTYLGLKAITIPSFGVQALGTTATAQTFTVTDPSGLPLNHAISVSLPSGTNFTLPSGSTCTASASVACTLSVAFSPHTAGLISETMTITDLRSGKTEPVTLTGIAGSPVVMLSPTSIVFPLRVSGSTSIPVTVTLTNTGNAPLTVSSVAVTADTTGSFSQTNNCGTVYASSTCSIYVTFAPLAPGSSTASVSIVSTAASSPDSIGLSGTAD